MTSRNDYDNERLRTLLLLDAARVMLDRTEFDELDIATTEARDCMADTVRRIEAELLASPDKRRLYYAVVDGEDSPPWQFLALVDCDAESLIEKDVRSWDDCESAETRFVNVRYWTLDGRGVRDESDVRVTIEPEAPECVRGADGEPLEHDWKQVSTCGHGGGVIVVERCADCALELVTDTWAQDPANGEQGLTTVEYRTGEED